MDMKDNDYIMTFSKRGLKTRSYNMDMNKEDHITTFPKRGLKRDHIKRIWRRKISRNLLRDS